ncbi:MAG: hypothetical protein ACFCGT_07355 [Sandaracinaceae bacterium]
MAAALGWLLLVGPATAQSGAQPGHLDFAVPDMPAIVLLGAAPTQVSRPRTFQEIVGALASGITVEGRVQSGLGVEYRPAPVEWLGISIATNVLTPEGGSSSPTGQAALGLRLTLGPNPETSSLRACIAEALRARRDARRDPSPDDPLAEPDVRIVQVPAIPLCRDIVRTENLARQAVEIATSAGLEIPGNEVFGGSVNFFGSTVWLNAVFAAANWGPERPPADQLTEAAVRELVKSRFGLQWSAFARGTLRRRPDADLYRGELFAGSRVELFYDVFNLFLDVGARPPIAAAGSDDLQGVSVPDFTQVQVVLGGEVRVSNGTWLAFSFGGDLVDETQTFNAGRFFSLANLRFSPGESPRFASDAAARPEVAASGTRVADRRRSVADPPGP